MNAPEQLSDQQVADLRRLAGLGGAAHAALLKRHNHVYRITRGDDVFFLKTYTKDWYGEDVIGTGGCVEHETAAWSMLAGHGIPVPEVVLARRDCDTPLDRPLLMTRKLRGTALTELLAHSGERDFRAVLAAAGAFLRRVHLIAFEQLGYIMDGGPTGLPEDGGWQHGLWSARQTQRDALAVLAADRPRLSPALVHRLEARLQNMAALLAPGFEPPRFTHGDCHASQFFLYQDDGQWRVSGFVDLEVASAGDCVGDLLKFCTEMAVTFPSRSRWWEPFFSGYGETPPFDLFRLRLLGWHEVNFACYGKPIRPREAFLTHLLDARDWADLFDL